MNFEVHSNFYISLAYYGFVRMYCATDQNTSFLVIKLRIYHMTFEKPEIFWGGQGWTIGLAHSPRRVSKVSGECKSQITLKLKTARSTTCATTLQANCSWSIRVPLVSWKLKWFLSGSESRWREKERKKPESCLWFKGLKGVREEQIEEVFSEMANWPAMVAAWSG